MRARRRLRRPSAPACSTAERGSASPLTTPQCSPTTTRTGKEGARGRITANKAADMSTSVTTGTVVTAGADIYFERRGSGPGLLVISGGGGGAGNYSDLADSLA